MASRELESSIFGRDVSFAYSETWVGYSLLALRFVMGWTFLLPGIQQAWDPTWSASGFLLYGIPDGNPLTGFFTYLGQEWVIFITPMNSIGLTLIGLALIFGAFVRFAAFWGSVMMFFYYLASLHGGVLQGLPLANGFVVDDHIVYILILFGIGAFGAGRILGLDAKLEQLDVVQRYPRLKLFLG